LGQKCVLLLKKNPQFLIDFEELLNLKVLLLKLL